jgi:hypothetical protein
MEKEVKGGRQQEGGGHHREQREKRATTDRKKDSYHWTAGGRVQGGEGREVQEEKVINIPPLHPIILSSVTGGLELLPCQILWCVVMQFCTVIYIVGSASRKQQTGLCALKYHHPIFCISDVRFITTRPTSHWFATKHIP